MNCKVCQTKSEIIFHSIILNKYGTKFYQCPNCQFIQTEEPFWLEEAYSSVIASLDTGYVNRNLDMSSMTNLIIKYFFSSKGRFLDYGGGYGLFVRLMRDMGYDYYLNDQYCDNLFAQYFEIKDLSGNKKFELVSAFEVFEHFTDPISEIGKMFEYSDSILFSTSLQPSGKITNVKDWWYFMPETGQHISFYSMDSLKIIAEKFNCFFYSNGRNLHIFTRKKHYLNLMRPITYSYYFKQYLFNFLFKRKSLANHDFELIKQELLIRNS